MEVKRKPTRWGLWLVIWLALLVAYPLSYGPVFYALTRDIVPLPYPVVYVAYIPLRWVLFREYPPRDPITRAFLSYARYWDPPITSTGYP